MVRLRAAARSMPLCSSIGAATLRFAAAARSRTALAGSTVANLFTEPSTRTRSITSSP